MSSIRVFISYSHDTESHAHRVRMFSDSLRTHGVDCDLDQYYESPSEGWPRWMTRQLSDATYVLVISTANYLRKFDYPESSAGGGVQWEGMAISQEIYEAKSHNTKFIPVVFEDSSDQFVPKALKGATIYYLGQEKSRNNLYRRLTRQPRFKKPRLGKLIPFPTERIRGGNLLGSNTGRKKGTQEIRDVNQNAQGTGNIQVVGTIGSLTVRTPQPASIKILPSMGTIGANSLLAQSIKRRFNQLGEEREKRFGKSAYSVMYKNFSREFGIHKNLKWTIIWTWPESTAQTIIDYIDKKYDNSIAGRAKVAIAKGTLIPSKGHLYKTERELLSGLDLETSDPHIKSQLKLYFGVSSRSHLSRLQHWLWVKHLEQVVERMITGELS